ncbi:MAG TPA: alpha-L-fucosidase, partial [Acidobacteriaceae bacterium]
MNIDAISRRSLLKQLGSAAAFASSAHGLGLPPRSLMKGSLMNGSPMVGQSFNPQTPAGDAAQTKQAATRAERMAWWHAAKFGMFIHWGLYSVIGQHEWALEQQGIPIPQYEILAKHFHPKPNAARDWARLAKRAGQKYMVMTTKHHEGFCM